jgi:hypothetical protein
MADELQEQQLKFSDYLQEGVLLPLQCSLLNVMQRKDAVLLISKKSQLFDTRQYSVEVFYKTINLPFDIK